MGQRGAIPRLRVLVSDERGRPIPDAGLASWLTRVAPARARGAVGVVLARDAMVRGLNRAYRGLDQATDVLAFPLDLGRGDGRSGAGPGRYLGDVVIARGVARRQAREAGHGERAELRVLALHGLLHLVGYDHHGPRAATMRRVERRLRRRGGLREGLIERAVAASGSRLRP